MSTPARPPNARTRSSSRGDATSRWVPVTLVVLALIPVVAGSARLVELSGGPTVLPDIVVGVAAIRQRDVASHRAWMTRAYALALGAGTQVFTQGIGEAAFGTHAVTRDLLLGSAWVINLAVAESFIRRDRPKRSKRLMTPIAGLS